MRDYHIHTTIRDGVHSIDEIAEFAIMKGFEEIGFSEHFGILPDDFENYMAIAKLSGLSSYMLLQNVIPTGATKYQEVAFALALAEKLLKGRGVCRVQGGGFAGTIQAFVPNDMLEEFKSGIDAVLGEDMCKVLKIRHEGGTAEKL